MQPLGVTSYAPFLRVRAPDMHDEKQNDYVQLEEPLKRFPG